MPHQHNQEPISLLFKAAPEEAAVVISSQPRLRELRAE